MVLAKRATLFEESVIRGMTRLCQQHDALNLAQGFPDWDPPRAVLDAAKRAIDGGYNQYAITWGSPTFRRAIARKMREVNGIDCDPEEEITVTCGATEAMMAAMLAVVDPGDEVVVFEPFYENYGPDVIVSGAQPVYVPLRFPDFRFDPDELRAAFSPRTKAIILNTPNNPTGKVFTREELTLIADLCRRFNALAITDEIYEHIIYGGRPHISIATLPGMRERTITICGHSKTYSVTGWRLAYAVAPPAITVGVRKMHDFLTVGAPAPLQEAGAAALDLPPAYYTELQATYDAKRRLLLGLLREVGFEAYDPQAAYYIMCDFSAFGFEDDTEFAHYLVKEIGVAGVPGSSFYHRRELGRTKIRFNFAKRDDVLREAGARLGRLRRR
jgi:aminotransferase